MHFVKKLLVLILALCMALSLVACADTSWVMKANDTVISPGIYIYYQTQGYVDAVYQLAAQDQNYYYYYMYGYSLLEDKLDDQLVSEYVDEYAMDMCRQYVVVDTLYNQLGLTLSDDDKAIIDNEVNTTWANSQEYLENIGVSKASLKAVITSTFKEERVFDAYYEIGGIKGTTEETINVYVNEQYARVKFIPFAFADSADDAIDAERKQSMLDQANAIKARAEAGESFDDLIAEFASSTEELADEVTDEIDAEAEEEEELYPNEFIIATDSTAPSQKFVKYVFDSCKVGELTVIQDDTSFYLVQRLDILEREDIMTSSRDFIISEIYDSDYTALINATLKGYTITVNDKAIKRYTAENAVMGPNSK